MSPGWLVRCLFLLIALGAIHAFAQDAPEAPESPEAPEEAEAPAPDDASQPESLLSTWQDRAAERALVGTWTATAGDLTTELTFRDDRTFTLNDLAGHYDVTGDRLTLTNGATFTYTWTLADGQLQIAGGDLQRPLAFQAQPRRPGYLSWLLDVSPETIGRSIQRIIAIVFVVLLARLLIYLARLVSDAMIFGQWGPLRLVYRARRNRARTVHSLVLNIVKYFIYFTALGTILAELGINYTTYLASLSVIGLAVGFGSQGLVQDMVTGFFIIFEGQFDVGDMIEISGQTGVVTEIGLRMTKLRNYLGQVVVIPNRNIATVANYSRGGQRTYIDIAVTDAAAAERALPLAQQFGEELLKQYEGVVLPPIRVSGPMRLATGETFVRLHLSIWPGQTWIVDQQVIPRLRERMKAAELEIPADRVAAFYHARESVPVTGWRQTLSWIRDRFDGPERDAPGAA